MKDLVFSISLRNHTFKIKATPRSTLCYYDNNEGAYTTSLIFAANTYASVNYKNVSFCGTVTKRNIWRVELDYLPILNKSYNSIYFLSNESVRNIEDNETTLNVTTEYPDKILWLYNQLVEILHEYYRSIEDKETFKKQLCKILAVNYRDEEIEDLDRIIEYENWDDVEADEEPVIEKRSLRNILIDEYQDCFICFRQSEIACKNMHAIITLDSVIAEIPELSQFPYELLQKEFCRYMDENDTDIITPDIWYYQEKVLVGIGVYIFKSCQYKRFMETLEENINTILSAMSVEDIDKDELYSYFKSHYGKDTLPSDEEFELSVKEYVDAHVAFNQLYGKFVSLFNTNRIKIEWNNEKLGLFQQYDERGQVEDSQLLAEYEAYKYVIPFYRKHFFRKNSNRYKPVIEQLPAFTAYGSSVLDILFKHKIITDNGYVVVYNNNCNIELAYKEILSILDK